MSTRKMIIKWKGINTASGSNDCGILVIDDTIIHHSTIQDIISYLPFGIDNIIVQAIKLQCGKNVIVDSYYDITNIVEKFSI